ATIDLLHDDVDLFADRQVGLVQRSELGALFLEQREQLAPKRLPTRSALFPNLGERQRNTKAAGEVGDHLLLGLGVRRAAIERNDRRDAEVPHVLDVLLEIRQSALE